MLNNHAAGLCSIDDEATRDGMYFRRRFRIPFVMFQALIKTMIEECWFPGFGPVGEGLRDATRRMPAVIDKKRQQASSFSPGWVPWSG